MQFSTTTLTLFLTALASLSTTQARIGQTHFTDNRMMVEEATLSNPGRFLNDGCPGGDEPAQHQHGRHQCPGRIRCWNLDFGGYCYPRIEEEECNQICRDYCTDEVPRWVMSVEDCMTKGIVGGCMYPEGLELQIPCKDNADD